MRVPSRYFAYTLNNGEEHKFRLTIGATRKLEETTKKKLEQILMDMGNDPIQSFIDMTWAASLPFNPDVTKEDMEYFYDGLVDDGLDQFDINGIIMNILQVSGLSDKTTNVDAEIDKIRKQASEGFTEED